MLYLYISQLIHDTFLSLFDLIHLNSNLFVVLDDITKESMWYDSFSNKLYKLDQTFSKELAETN